MNKRNRSKRPPAPTRRSTPGDGGRQTNELRLRAAAGAVYWVGIATGIVAGATMANEAAVRYHDHRQAFATASQVLVGLLIAFAVETRLRVGGDVAHGIEGGTLFMLCGGLVCSLVGGDLPPLTRADGGHGALLSFCFAATCGAIAAGIAGLATIYFTRST